MRLEQFKYLIAIKHCGSIHAAARELYISQQGISKAIKDLERELGIKLFVRKRTGTFLTNEGQDIYLHAKKIMYEIQLIQEKYTKPEKENIVFKDPLKIYISGYTPIFISNLISQLCMDYPFKISMVELSLNEIRSMLKKNDIEFAIVQSQINDLTSDALLKKHYSCFVLSNDRLKLIVNKHSSYSKYRNISLKALSEIPLVINSTSLNDVPFFIQVLKNMGISLNIRYLTNSKMATNYVKDNLACALVTDSINFLTTDDENFEIIPIKEKIYISYCLLISKNKLSAPSKIFCDYVLNENKYEKIF